MKYRTGYCQISDHRFRAIGPRIAFVVCALLITESLFAERVARKPRQRRSPSSETSLNAVTPTENRIQIAPVVAFDYLTLTAPSIDGWNSGSGISAGARGDIPIAERYRISPSLKFTSWKLSREVDSGVSTDPDVYEQTLGYLAIGATLGYGILGNGPKRLWLETGLEFLWPLSASQSENGGAPASFSNRERPLLLSAGARWDIEFSEGLTGELQGLVHTNVMTSGGSYLVGLRAQFSLAYAL